MNTLNTYELESYATVAQKNYTVHTPAALTYVNSHGLHQYLTNDINAPLPGTYNPQVPTSGIYPLQHADPVFLVELTGLCKNEVIANVNSTLNEALSLFGSDLYNRAKSNTDYSPPPQNTDFNPAITTQGFGVGSFPANAYNFTGEYGPASTDIRNQGTFGGTIDTKWGFRFSPLFVVDSGARFNITIGQDLYGTTLFNGRPGIATDPTRPGLVPSPYGLLDPNPIPVNRCCIGTMREGTAS